jgi:predicted esterase
MVVIHGTGGNGRAAVHMFRALADEFGFALVGPDSRMSPHGEWTWQVGQNAGETTPDLVHIVGSLDEVARLHADRLDLARVLIAGVSGGGSSAPYVATKSAPFTHFAVLHGGVFRGGLGQRAVRGWFSTGTGDTMRSPSMVRQAVSDASAAGMEDLTYREFPGGHAVGTEEQRALVTWWLGQ